MTKWYTERKWELSSIESKFENSLKEKGFEILGLKEYNSKTDFLISKDGLELTATFVRDANFDLNASISFIENDFKTKMKLKKFEDMM